MDPRKQDSVKMLQSFIVKQRPEVIAVGADGRTGHDLYKILKVLVGTPEVRKVSEGDNARGSPPEVVFVDEELPRIFATSGRGAKEFQERNALTRQAISVARSLQDPTCEYAHLLGDETDFFQLSVHPLQDMLDRRLRVRIADECITDAVNRTGVDINHAIKNEHQASTLRFVSGLGPRKAQHIFGLLENTPAPVENRSELQNRKLVSAKVAKSCGAFLRINPAHFDEHHKDELEPLDNTMVDPDDYVLARKMSMDALDQDADADDMDQISKRAISDVISKVTSKDGFNRCDQKLDDLDLDLYAAELKKNHDMGDKVAILNDIKLQLQNT
jgi:transcription elongation factor SPT6